MRAIILKSCFYVINWVYRNKDFKKLSNKERRQLANNDLKIVCSVLDKTPFKYHTQEEIKEIYEMHAKRICEQFGIDIKTSGTTNIYHVDFSKSK